MSPAHENADSTGVGALLADPVNDHVNKFFRPIPLTSPNQAEQPPAVGGFVASRETQHETIFWLGQDPRTRRKEMRLNAAQLSKVEDQIGVEAVSDEHAAIPKLREVFGDHTFFLDARGLIIVEPKPSPETSSGNVVKLASWVEEDTELQVHEPQVLSVTVDLGPEKSDPAA